MAGSNLKDDGIGSGDRAPPSSTTTTRPPPPLSSAIQKTRRENPSPKPVPTTSNKQTPNKTNSNPNPLQPGPHHPPEPHPHSHPHPPFSFHEPSPRPSYGFQMLDRRTIILIDGTVRSYFALPPDYHNIPLQLRFTPSRLPSGGPDHPMKRKFGEEMDRERQKQQVLQYGGNVGSSSPFKELRPPKVMKLGGGGSSSNSNLNVEVDPAITKAFLNYINVIYDNVDTKRNLLGNGKHGPVHCLACGGSSRDFPDVHSLVMHAYNSNSPNSRVDHLGLHKALCALMGWNCTRVPDDSRVYQFLPAEEAVALQGDLIMWPPTVIIHNTNTGKGKVGRMEGLGNKAMDSYIRDLGFSGGKSRSLYNKEGHLGMTLVKFAGDQLGLKEAMNLSDHFEKDRHGRKDWAHLQSTGTVRDDENNPNLVTMDERTGEKRRILYGYLLTASDLEKVDYDTRKKSTIESKLEKLHASK